MNHYYQNVCFEKNCFKTSAIFEEGFLKLTIFQNGTAWYVNLSTHEIKKQSKEADSNEYYENLKMYLISCPEDVAFSFIQGKFTIYLLLKNKMKVLFFTSILKQVDFVENIFHLVDTLYNDKTLCCKKLNNLERQHKILQTDVQQLKKNMDIFLNRKKSEEEKLHSKFLMILNEKKEHIQHLNDVIISFQKIKSTVTPFLNKEQNICRSRNNVATKKITNTTKFEDSDSTPVNTDSKESDNIDKISIISRNSTGTNLAGPSTVKSKHSFEEDSPTILPSFSQRIRSDLISNVPLTNELSEDSIHQPIITMDVNTTTNDIGLMANFNTQDLLDSL